MASLATKNRLRAVRKLGLVSAVSLFALSLAPSAALAAADPVKKTNAVSPPDKKKKKNTRKAVPLTAESISVVGMGSTRQVQALGKEQFSTYVAGTNPMKMLNQLPGVTFMSSDPLGIDIWSWDLYIRGFEVGELASTIDGIPAMDVQNFVSQSNLGHVSVSQGAGGVDVPSVTNLGGHIGWSTDTPKDRYGGTISQTFGSYAAYDTFVRFDSGQIGKHGTKFFVSYDRASEGQWVGGGSEFREVVNAKLDQPIDEHSHLKAFFAWAYNSSDPYPDLSMNILNTLGQRITYYKPNYAAAYRAALAAQGLPGGSYPAGYDLLQDPADASYYDGPNRFSNYMAYVKYNNQLTNRLNLDASFYGLGRAHHGLWATPYMEAPNGSPLTEQDFVNMGQEGGLTASLKYRLAKHLIEGGVWYDHTNDDYTKRYYEEPVLGEGAPLNSLNPLPSSAYYGSPYNIGYHFDTLQIHLQDTYKPVRNLTINAGFRSIIYSGTSHIIENDPTYTGQSSLPHGTLHYNSAFLPQVGITYRIDHNNELFFDFSKNLSVFGPGSYNSSSPWGAADWATFNYIRNNIQPESDYVYEVGYRYSSPWVRGLVDLYHTDYRNRVGSITVGSIVDSESVLANLGSVQMYGVDTSLTVTPVTGLDITNSFSYNSSKYDNDVTTDGVTYALKGKSEVNYPHYMYKSTALYTWKEISANISAAYTSARPLSYVNDVIVPGYWLVNTGASYRVPKKIGPGHLTISFTVYNLLNDKYIGQLGENGNPMSGDYQSFNMGAPRTFYGSLSYHF
ncbi:TonB-dependent receptor [Acidomonas methanolica]|uniref:TonB-dependent receptor n=1 Tax=Acidomonas methanolica NBRC 104435 TaxID=1231351 RepID=A0A023D2Y8_ACIMT|nr:TonB-dependent receptor [Acidomonas methanolica]MBU2654532.1 TonB-dependent receptor [Acidomonas methanolica]TCS27404.1 iron complex outermembrane receptor protein [Acidomonas methanolica]GAJ28115.1 TonB-dependent receptor [Acidomonas methanolica NBRC 104435]GBQ46518.1 outer membrane receptor [Acidomonas methanolica]GEK98689.1 TonB-dependent receptor [Acidomonas methanolica NBRC 104435]